VDSHCKSWKTIQTAIEKLVCQLFVPAKEAHFQSERYELVPVQKEANPIRTTQHKLH